jgi:hypothetical protein
LLAAEPSPVPSDATGEPAAAASASVAAVEPKSLTTLLIEKWFAPLGQAPSAPRHYTQRQWAAAGAGIVVVAVLGYLFTAHFSGRTPAGEPAAEPAGAASSYLPDPLRNAASCKPYDANEKSDKCVINAGDPLLWGQIAGGRDVTFYVQIAPRAHLAETVSQWRAAGGAIVEDDQTFAEIGPSANVMYANAATGLRVDTGIFQGEQGAKEFLSRSGLGRG